MSGAGEQMRMMSDENSYNRDEMLWQLLAGV
jgi:hypothetical protein